MLSVLRSLLAGPPGATSVEDAARWMAEGAVLVDVREPSEWQSGHARGAIHIPLSEIQARGRKALEARGVTAGAGDNVLLICRSGMRSGVACQALRGEASFKAINVKGGMIAWQRAGLPMEGSR